MRIEDITFQQKLWLRPELWGHIYTTPNEKEEMNEDIRENRSISREPQKSTNHGKQTDVGEIPSRKKFNKKGVKKVLLSRKRYLEYRAASEKRFEARLLEDSLTSYFAEC